MGRDNGVNNKYQTSRVFLLLRCQPTYENDEEKGMTKNETEK